MILMYLSYVLHSLRDMQRSCRFVSSGYLCSLTYSIKRSHAKVLLVCELYGERIHALVMVNDRLLFKVALLLQARPNSICYTRGTMCVPTVEITLLSPSYI
jgi:hypothetical protein